MQTSLETLKQENASASLRFFVHSVIVASMGNFSGVTSQSVGFGIANSVVRGHQWNVVRSSFAD